MKVLKLCDIKDIKKGDIFVVYNPSEHDNILIYEEALSDCGPTEKGYRIMVKDGGLNGYDADWWMEINNQKGE